jgi:hypothetical protein
VQPAPYAKAADHGFGDPQNSYAFSMAWFGSGLHIGTVRNLLAMVSASPPADPARMHPWPVPVPDDLFQLDLRAQIWRTSGPGSGWEQEFVSPMLDDPEGRPAPRDIGYRCMAVFEGASDPRPALYVATAASNSRGRGAHVLRITRDGGVTPVGTPGLGDGNVSTMRTLLPADGLLYTSPAGSGRAWNAADSPSVYVTDDPVRTDWRAVSEPGFGNPDNDALYSMAHFAGHLYVGTLNPTRGYEVWRGRPDPRGSLWECVVDRGAGRGPLNEAAMTMCVFGGCLYVGSGISNGGYDRTYGVGPAAGEVIRIHPDGRWELVVGTARDTDGRTLVPTSGFGPGFDNPCTGYVWSMAVHEGRLYVGTFDSTIFGLWADPRSRARWNGPGIEARVAERAGAELWRTSDGDEWTPVTTQGFGNVYNYGIRTLASTPHGLYAGTANPFGPDVAVRFADGWKFTPNRAGGAEVWLVEPALPVPADPPATPAEPPTSPPVEVGPPVLGPGGPLGLGVPAAVLRRFFDGSAQVSLGWWDDDTTDPVQAATRQLEVLVCELPTRLRAVLDLSGSPLFTTPRLATALPLGTVEGVLGSVAEMRRAPTGPRHRFVLGDPEQLERAGAPVDAVVSAYGTDPGRRAAWLASAHRQLVPGGCLALLDLVRTEPEPGFEGAGEQVAEQAGVQLRYRHLLLDAGFRRLEVHDVSAGTWLPFVDRLLVHLRLEVEAGRLPTRRASALTERLEQQRLERRALLVRARKV